MPFKKLTLFLWEKILLDLEREEQSELLPYLPTSFCLTVLGMVGAARAATDILDTEEALFSSRRMENTMP